MSNQNIDGVLVRLSISQFQNTKKDKEMTQSVTEQRKLGKGAGKWIKTKFPEEALAQIQTHLSSGLPQRHPGHREGHAAVHWRGD